MGVGIAACNNEYQDFEEPTPPQNPVTASFNKEFSVALERQGGLSKASQNWGDWYLNPGDEMSVFSGTANNKFVNAYNGVFQGNAADAEKYYALFPYQEGATIADGVISTTISATQTTDTATVNGSWNQFNNALLSVGVTTDKEKSFALKNVGSAIMFYINGDKPVDKVEITAGKDIAGPVKITIGDDDIPTVEGGDSKTITINNPLVRVIYNYVSTLPVGETDLEVKYYRDGKVCGTRKYEKVNLSRNAMANLGYINYRKATFDTGVEGATIESVSFQEGNGCGLPNIGDIANGDLTFAGWRAPNDTVYAEGNWFSSPTFAYGDIQFTAEWVDGYVLRYSYNGMPPVVFKAGDEITLADFPETEVGKYTAWKYTAWIVDGEEKQPGDKIKPNGNVNVDLKWEYKSFKVTIDANGGKFEDGSDKIVVDMSYSDNLNLYDWNSELQRSQMHIYKNWWSENEWLGDSPRPSRDGYVFRYFYFANDEKVSYFGNPTSDTTIYAKWYKKYAIEYYNGNGDRMWKNEDNYYTEEYTTFWITSNYYSENNEDILVGWKDQDGNVYDRGKYYPISMFDEPHGLKLTPVFESDDNASSHESWTAKPF